MELPEKTDKSVDLVLDEEDFVIITDEDIKSNIHLDELIENINDVSIEDQIIKVEKDFEHWTELRRDTISKLREIADYIG